MAVTIKWNSRKIAADDGEELARRVSLDIRQIGERAVKGVSQDIRDGGEAIAELAREYAPYAAPWLEHNAGSEDPEAHLEAAIETKEIPDPSRRVAIRVFVNGNKPGHDGKPIGQYAYLMHEHEGEWSESTLEKPGAGSHYLLRAYQERADAIQQRAENTARKVFGK